jgi:hypothetical protein
MEDKLIGLIPRRLIYFFGAVASLGFLFGTLYIVIFRQTEFRAVVMGMLGQEKSVSLKKLKLSEALRRRRRSADTHVDDA